MGNTQAPVTIIEYGSITCGKCVRFHREVLPLLKSDYIKTGKVRFIYRDYPTSDEAYRGAIAAHCAGPDKYYPLLDALYHAVADWSQAKDVEIALTDIAISLDLNRETFSTCLNDPQQALNIEKEREEAVLEYDVFGTPTFIINGKVIRGLKTFDEMKVLIEKASSQSH
ncbi:MAG: DsbA family protein [Gammaproteobacteria bacterium]|nr:DsbA family protein [Gammaproteobacteria bacterium]